jgi:hypothetical protein
MIVPLTLFFSGAALLASAVYAANRLNRQASAAFALERSIERHAGRREMAEAPDGWPYAL